MTGEEIQAFSFRFVYGEDGTGIKAAGEALVRALQRVSHDERARVLVKFSQGRGGVRTALADHVLNVDDSVRDLLASLEWMAQSVLIRHDVVGALEVRFFFAVGGPPLEFYARRIIEKQGETEQ